VARFVGENEVSSTCKDPLICFFRIEITGLNQPLICHVVALVIKGARGYYLHAFNTPLIGCWRHVVYRPIFNAYDSRSYRARLLSLPCWHAGAYLNTVPVNSYVCLSDDDITDGGRFCLEATGALHVPASTSLVGVTSRAAISTKP
jgi:hypothetical protein